MTLSMLDNAVEFGKDITYESFSLVKIKYKNCSEVYTMGTFPCQQISFVLQRQLGYFMIQVSFARFLSSKHIKPCFLCFVGFCLAFFTVEMGNLEVTPPQPVWCALSIKEHQVGNKHQQTTMSRSHFRQKKGTALFRTQITEKKIHNGLVFWKKKSTNHKCMFSCRCICQVCWRSCCPGWRSGWTWTRVIRWGDLRW